MINHTAVNGLITKTIAEFVARSGGSEAAGEGYRNLLTRLGEVVERMSNADINVVAYDVIDRELDGVNVGGLHKIQLVKDIRNVTLAGIKEAKEAYEYALGEVIRDRANAALKALAEHNRSEVHRSGYRQYVSALNHHDVLTDLQSAADAIPF